MHFQIVRSHSLFLCGMSSIVVRRSGCFPNTHLPVILSSLGVCFQEKLKQAAKPPSKGFPVNGGVFVVESVFL